MIEFQPFSSKRSTRKLSSPQYFFMFSICLTEFTNNSSKKSVQPVIRDSEILLNDEHSAL